MWVMGEWSVGQWIVGVISFQEMYGLYGLKHHTVEINGDVTMRTDDEQVNIVLLTYSVNGQCETEFRNYTVDTHDDGEQRKKVISSS